MGVVGDGLKGTRSFLGPGKLDMKFLPLVRQGHFGSLLPQFFRVTVGQSSSKGRSILSMLWILRRDGKHFDVY